MTSRRVLLDKNMPLSLRLLLKGVDAVTVELHGWKGVRNADLIGRALAHDFDVLVTPAGAWQ